MTYQKVGTVEIKGVVSINITIPTFITSGSSKTAYYKFTATVSNDTGSNYKGAFVVWIITDNSYTSSSFDLDDGKTITSDFYLDQNSFDTAGSTTVYAVVESSDGYVISDVEGGTFTFRSPPTLSKHTFSTDSNSYEVGDSLTPSITLNHTETNDVMLYTYSLLYDASSPTKKAHTFNTITIDPLASNKDTTKSFTSWTIASNSYTLGTWEVIAYTSVGWSGDEVYYFINNQWESYSFYSNSYKDSVDITVSKKVKKEVVIASSDHTIPETITKGESATIGINVKNTYSVDKSGSIKLLFGYPSGKTTYDNQYTTSSDFTFTKNTTQNYDLSITIPTSAPNGTYDVKAQLTIS